MIVVTVQLREAKNGKPVGGADRFEAETLPLLVGKINYWLRIEVGPYWPAGSLRWELTLVDGGPEQYRDLITALTALGIAWRLVPGFDPEDEDYSA